MSSPSVQILCGDCVAVMREMAAGSVDAIVTDPPYALRFMSKAFDTFENNRVFQAWCEEWAAEALRVLKPGGHLLAFGGTRTYHRMVCGIEDAGFDIRDCLQYLYGSGFPKSLDVGKQLDKAAGAERVRGELKVSADGTVAHNGSKRHPGYVRPFMDDKDWQGLYESKPTTDDAKRWDGWGTALKPAYEIIVMARKSLVGTVASNVQQYGTGALNVDGCRIPTDETLQGSTVRDDIAGGNWGTGHKPAESVPLFQQSPSGRWPANVVLGCACEGEHEPECAVRLLDEQSGTLASGANPTRRGGPKFRNAYGEFQGQEECQSARGANSGGASRFFYCAKASRAERGTGNTHPTVKPISLMRWLIRLVTPPGGVVLDPFAGSGSTLLAAVSEGVPCIGIEREAEYVDLIHERLRGVTVPLPLEEQPA